MRLLALETATLAGGAALLDDGRLVGESRLNIALTHSERLMLVVDRLLGDCGWDVASLDAVAVSIGPGSFTGLRVGIVSGRTFAFALQATAHSTPAALRHPWLRLPTYACSRTRGAQSLLNWK